MLQGLFLDYERVGSAMLLVSMSGVAPRLSQKHRDKALVFWVCFVSKNR